MPTSSSRTTSQPKAASTPRSSEESDLPPRNPHKQKKTLFIGDSISANVNKEALVDATKTTVVTARAYSSVYDIEENVAKYPAKFPKSNFTDVVPAQLNKDEYQTLLLQAGSVDITNLNTKDDPAKYLEYFRQQTVISATSFFKSGENALSTHPNLEKVVLMKQTLRYDPCSVDPLCIKPALSQLFNNTVSEQWLKSQYKDKIFIGNHNIDCMGAIKEARYRDTKSGRFDGLHLIGSSGQKAYTNSVLNILKGAQLVETDYDYYHQNCPQNRRRNSNSYSQAVKGGNIRNIPQQERIFTLPTQNRFERLSGLSMNQGN